MVNAASYLIGGLIFILGSIFFLPAFEKSADPGALIFVFGSLVYLLVTGHDMVEVLHNRRVVNLSKGFYLELLAAVSYLTGTILFTIGSVFFLSRVDLPLLAAWCFIVGSLLFVVGSCINVLQVVKARSLRILQLMNLTAISFVVGSVLFATASVPYLWNFMAKPDRVTLFSFCGWLYVIGSALFLAGGLFNWRRAYMVWGEEMAARPRATGQ